jgi:hypothetical protein
MRNILKNYLFPAIVLAGLVLALIFYYPVHAQLVDPNASNEKVMMLGGDVNMFDDKTLLGVPVRCWYITGGGISCI